MTRHDIELKISDRFNNNHTYTFLQEIAEEFFNKEIDGDNEFWHELEVKIVDMIIEAEDDSIETCRRGKLIEECNCC
tara:strand:- start:184 stop:414 length:231 start_codon:yes stop_codon:yes gene_type:complete